MAKHPSFFLAVVAVLTACSDAEEASAPPPEDTSVADAAPDTPPADTSTDDAKPDAPPDAPPLMCPTAASPPSSTIPADALVPLPWDLAIGTGVERVVTSKEEFKQAGSLAKPGDVIAIASGTHVDWGELEVTSSGEPGKPIIVRPRDAAVVFEGITQLAIRGSHVHVYGLGFRATGPAAGAAPHTGSIRIGGSATAKLKGNRFSRIHCKGVRAETCLIASNTEGTRFDHSLVEESSAKGIHVSNNTRHMRIDHNVFRNRSKPIPSNGFEQVQLGHFVFTTDARGADTLTVVRTDALVDHNVFQACEGDPEMIGLKTAGNKIVLNVLADAPGRGNLSFRGGPNNLAFGNVFRRTQGGTRIFGKSNRFLHNVVVDPTAGAGAQLPWGNDTAYRRHASDGTPTANYFVDYVAARDGLVRNNAVIFGAATAATVRALAEDRQSNGECSAEPVPYVKLDAGTTNRDLHLDCTVAPFGNVFARNALINDRGGETLELSSTFADKNDLSGNVVALSKSSVLTSDAALAASLGPSFTAAPAELAGALRAIADFVRTAPQNGACLRIRTPSRLGESATMATVFEPLSCEARCEDEGAEWLGVDLFASDTTFAKHDDVIKQIASLSEMVLPAVPTPG